MSQQTNQRTALQLSQAKKPWLVMVAVICIAFLTPGCVSAPPENLDNICKIFEEKDETFTVGISISSDDKWFIIHTGDENTTEEWFFPSRTKEIKPKLFRFRKKDIKKILINVNLFKKYFFYKNT